MELAFVKKERTGPFEDLLAKRRTAVLLAHLMTIRTLKKGQEDKAKERKGRTASKTGLAFSSPQKIESRERW